MEKNTEISYGQKDLGSTVANAPPDPVFGG